MFTARTVLLLTFLLLFGGRDAIAQSLYADPKARTEGDVITIILQEQTSAESESSYENSSQAGLGARADVEGPTLSSRFSADATFNQDAESESAAAQRDLLTGRLTARVVGRDDAGNLIVEGKRELHVNGATHLLSVSGIVRPLDVRYNNTVTSPQIANAEVVYRKAGGITDRLFGPAFFAKVGAVGAVVAAVVLSL